MSFNSISFIVFFTVVVITFFALPHRWRWVLLLASSYFFYGYCQPKYLAVIIATTVVSYHFAKLIQNADNLRKRKLLLGLCISINIVTLIIFKYLTFFISSLDSLLNSAHVSINLPVIHILLPLGISFYTFRIVSYLMDVYRKDLKAESHLGMFALYVSFFPQLIAGPIERSPHLIPQFYEMKKFDPKKFIEGFSLILWGFFLKLVIADRVAIYVNTIYKNPDIYTGGHCLLAAYFFTYQIFCDFAGYSSIAIGVSRIFGYDLVDNFRRPYFSQSLREFWTRWNITLSTWFRDYLYIPLGGSRVSNLRHLVNLGVVFLLSGLWHGANWTFLAWGGIHGLGVITSELTSEFKSHLLSFIRLKAFHRTLAVARVVVTFHLVCLAWVFFRANSISQASTILANLFTGWHLSLNDMGLIILPYTGDNSAVAVFLTSVFFIGLMQVVELILENRTKRVFDLWNTSGVFKGFCLASLMLIILFFGEFTSSPFIYRQF